MTIATHNSSRQLALTTANFPYEEVHYLPPQQKPGTMRRHVYSKRGPWSGSGSVLGERAGANPQPSLWNGREKPVQFAPANPISAQTMGEALTELYLLGLLRVDQGRVEFVGCGGDESEQPDEKLVIDDYES